MEINLTVNGQKCFYEFTDENVTLLFYLRTVLRLTAAKNGCGEGHCGACTVILDGKAVLSCMKKMKDLDLCSVLTLEALSDGENIHALIFSFAREGAVQCGFCTPGFIMSAKALLDQNPDPDEKAIRKALAKNICRCTGYIKILKAVRVAAGMMREGRVWINRNEILPDRQSYAGESVVRIDSISKAAGETIFADDMVLDGMLHAKVLRSSLMHADIVSIDTSEAERSPGVIKILLSKDIPGDNSFGPIKKDQQVLADKRVRYCGDAIAAVFAETEKEAVDALSKIHLEYRKLPVLTGFDEALADDAMQLHEGESNVIATMVAGRGNPDAGFSASDLVIEEEYDTQYIEHAYLEPESCIAELKGSGELIIHVASQGPPMDIGELSPVLGIAAERIHIAGMPMGGGFGGKEDISVQIIAALGALFSGRPVKYTFSRRESIITSGKRNATHLRYKTGVTKDGLLKAVKVDISARGGAYASVEEAVILRSTSFAAGPYTVPASEIKAVAVYQNHAPTCAMRGFGNPVVTFGAETSMNKLSAKLKIDPIELRLRNVLEVGKTTITGDCLETSVGVKECLIAIQKELADYKMPEDRDGWAVGTGIACSYKNVGLGIGMDDSAGASGEILNDGRLMLRIGSVDMGQGADTAMAQILSEALGWPYKRITVHSADTKLDPSAGMTTASRQTFVSGNAVLKMAKKLNKQISNFLAAEANTEYEAVKLIDNFFYADNGKRRIMSLDDFIKLMNKRDVKIKAEARYSAPPTHFNLIEPREGYPAPSDGHLHAAYCFAAQATVLEVNKKTGRINILDVIIASDAGRIINKAAVEGQMEGGVVMGLGYALSEEYKEENGKVITDTYGKLGVRRIGQTPPIRCIIIENTHQHGPFGAKGMGELPISLSAPSVVHAVYNAVGVWINSLPVLPGKIIRAMEEKKTE
ncbi:MAG: molybdopterin-dependent oxidoreductase [Spirochaetales bacterium]|nr:molybdopterin-dependent oxidoreductase [Spirochaetales bacterium]